MATGQALEKRRPQEQALVRVAEELGIVRYQDDAMLIDLGSAELKKSYNVLAPATTLSKADPNFTPALSVVTLDPNDFYSIGKADGTEYFALAKVQLDQIAKVAGIEDLPPSISDFGERRQNVRVSFSARMRRPDGTWQAAHGSREWIEEDEHEALVNGTVPAWVLKVEQDGKPRPADMSNSKYVSWHNKEWARIKKFRLPMCESKARLRCYRELLTLKAKYSQAELAKPFLVVSTTFTPDTSDIRILGMLMSQGQQAAGLLYGAPAASDDTGEYEVIDPDTGEITSGAQAAPAAAPGADKETDISEAETHGERPTEDRMIPRGPFADLMLSDVCRDQPAYVKTKLLKTEALGPLAEQWLIYFHGREVIGDDLADISF